MDRDLEAENLKAPEPKIELSLAGDGFSSKKSVFPLNPFGETRYQTQESGNGPISEWKLKASVFDGAASCEIYTHNSQGKHTTIFVLEGLKDGDSIDQEVDFEMDEKKIPLRIELKYFIA